MSDNRERDEAMCVCGHTGAVHAQVFNRRGHCTAIRDTNPELRSQGRPCFCNIFREDHQ